MATFTENFAGLTTNTALISNTAATNNVWTQFGIGPALNPDTLVGQRVGGVDGDIKVLTSVGKNRLAVWGRKLTAFDSGIIVFTVGRISSGDSADWHYGVHFNTDQGDDTQIDNDGYVVFVTPNDGRVKLGVVTSGAVSFSLDTGANAVAVGDQVQVTWGPKNVTHRSNRIVIERIRSGATTSLLTSDDTTYNVGRLGICGFDAAAGNQQNSIDSGSGAKFITYFSYTDFGQRLADYGDDADSNYKGVAGRLYTDGATETNTVPAPLRARVLRAAARLQPLSLMRAGANAVIPDFVRGVVGVVNSGISNSGDFFNSYAAAIVGIVAQRSITAGERSAGTRNGRRPWRHKQRFVERYLRSTEGVGPGDRCNDDGRRNG